MKPVVFIGPTLSPQDVLAVIDADVRPPAARGDVLAAALERPAAIGLVDGYFDRVPAVWHKEILWAMKEGIHVFGAASMGALRAVELAPFGMEGVGEVFEAMRCALLSDDDDVAVAHASSEHAYRALSDAMVNIRATLGEAHRQGVLDGRARVELEAAAKSLSYPERTLPNLLKAARDKGVPHETLGVLCSWWPQNFVNQKRLDALLMLREMRVRADAGWSPKQTNYVFSTTDAWEALRREVTLAADARGRSRGELEPLLLDELCVGGFFEQASRNATARSVAAELAEHLNMAIDSVAINATAEDFRREHGLTSAEAFETWLQKEGLSRGAAVGAYFAREAKVRRATGLARPRLLQALEDHLRATREHARLKERALAKDAWFKRSGMGDAISGVTEAELWCWFFTQVQRMDVPADLERAATTWHVDLASLRRAVLREFLFVRFGTT